MRRFVTSFILALLIISGSGVTFAQNNHRGNDRKEHNTSISRPGNSRPGSNNNKGNNNRPNVGNNKGQGNDKHHGGNVGNRPGGNRPGGNVGNRPGGNRPGNNNSYARPGSTSGSHHRPSQRPSHNRPTPPPPPPHHNYHHNLGPMIHHAINGAHDVNIWQVDYDTYVVRYRIGNRLYAQYIYPNSGRYGERSLISVNWQPRSPWIAIPPITFNINL